MSIPLQDDLNPSDPEEHVLWALVNINEDLGAPLLLPIENMRAWSKHLFQCGFRHHEDLQEKWFIPPSGDTPLYGAVGGKWSDTPPEKRDEAAEILANLPTGVKADLKARLLAEDMGEA